MARRFMGFFSFQGSKGDPGMTGPTGAAGLPVSLMGSEVSLCHPCPTKNKVKTDVQNLVQRSGAKGGFSFL
jgi:hypothetical protein